MASQPRPTILETLAKDNVYRAHFEQISSENASLKTRVMHLAEENEQLKRSVFLLSNKLSQLQEEVGQVRRRPFNIDELLYASDDESATLTAGVDAVMASPSCVRSGSRGLTEAPERPASPGAIASASRGHSENAAAERRAEVFRPLRLVTSTPDLSGMTHSVSEAPTAFRQQTELAGHNGAVYSCCWSPCGRFLASGSFDRTARIWVLYSSNGEALPHESPTLSGHSQLVCDVRWGRSSRVLLTGSYDHTVRLWDVARAELQATFEVEGLAQTVAFDPKDDRVFYCGTSKGRIHVFDARARGGRGGENGAHANGNCGSVSSAALDDGSESRGSPRSPLLGCGLSPPNSPKELHPPSSRSQQAHGTQSPWHKISRLAVSLRELKDDGSERNATPSGEVEGNADSASANGVPSSRPRLMVNSLLVLGDHSLMSGDSQGFIRTWDARFGSRSLGGDIGCTLRATQRNEMAGRPISHLAISAGSSPELLAVNSYDNVLRVYDRAQATSSLRAGNRSTHSMPVLYELKGHQNKNWPIRSSFGHLAARRNEYFGAIDVDDVLPRAGTRSSMLLASGSTTSSCYVYDVGTPGAASLVQKLRGHTDRVYSCEFHPIEPVLATCSADTTIKIWC